MPWVSGALAIGGALISANAAGDAASQQQQGNDKAIGETQRQYDTTRGDLAPYRDAGSAALTRLRALLGIGPTQGGAGSVPGIKQPTWDDAAAEQLAWHQAKYGSGYTGGSDMTANQAQTQARYDRMMADYNAQVAAQPAPDTSTGPTSEFGDSPLLRSFTTADLNVDPVYNSGLQFGLDEGTKAIERRSAAAGGLDSGATLKALTRFGNDYGSTKAADAYSRFTGKQADVYSKLSGIAGLGSGATSVGVNAGNASASNLASLYTGGANAQGAASIAGGNAISGGLNNAANLYSQQNLLQQLTGGGARSTTPLTTAPNLTGASDLGAVG